MIETRRLKNVVIFIQTVLSYVLSRKIILNILSNSIPHEASTIDDKELPWFTKKIKNKIQECL